ncbi:MAG: hypothetical protein WA979_12080 [Pacificimonas sp.]
METGTYISAGQAATLAGVSKATISKALKSGKISYISKDKSGYQIDPAEVARVYPPKPSRKVEGERSETPVNTHENRVLEVELKAANDMRSRLEAEIEDLKTQRDKWQGQAERLLLERPAQEQTKARPGLFGRIMGKG